MNMMSGATAGPSGATAGRPRVLSVRPWRPPGPGNTLPALLAEHNIELVEAPLQDVQLATGLDVTGAVETLREGRTDHVVLTHARAVDALVRAAGGALSAPTTVRVHAVGRTAAETATEHGLTVADASAEPPSDLAPGQRVLLVGSTATTTPLQQAWQEAGAQVTRVDAYALVPRPLPAKILDEMPGFAAVLVASPATARLLATALTEQRPAQPHPVVRPAQLLPSPPVVAVSKRVADACRAEGLPVVAIAGSGAEADIAATLTRAILETS